MVRRLIGPIAVLAAALASPQVWAQDDSANQAAIAQASARGRLIYAYDQAAWRGTDDLLARDQAITQKLGGWIVDGPAERPTLVFFDRDPEHPHALYVAEFSGGKLMSGRLLGDTDDRTISPSRLAMIHARSVALAALAKAPVQRCSDKALNSVVLPPDRVGAPTSVYALEPQPDMRTFPIGGSYRLDVDADDRVSPPRPFAKTCFALTSPADQKPQMFVATHLLDPVPTEIHVFTSLAAHLPVMVATTDKAMWLVNGDRITRVKDR